MWTTSPVLAWAAKVRTKSLVTEKSLLTTARVVPARSLDRDSSATATTMSQPRRRFASPAAMREAWRRSCRAAMRTCDQTGPPFCARPAMSSTETPLPSSVAAVPSSAPIVTTPVPPTPVTRMP